MPLVGLVLWWFPRDQSRFLSAQKAIRESAPLSARKAIRESAPNSLRQDRLQARAVSAVPWERRRPAGIFAEQTAKREQAEEIVQRMDVRPAHVVTALEDARACGVDRCRGSSSAF